MTVVAESEDKGRVPRKSATAYRTISEVSEELSVPQHVLRFWETKFSQIRPLKRGGGRRYYRPEDVALLRRIQKLLYDDGFTIKGVQKLLREGRSGNGEIEAQDARSGEIAPAAREGAASTANASLPEPLRAELRELLEDLRALRDALRAFES